jgi:purine nucleosidase
MAPRKIIIDPDPGQDDAFVILFAARLAGRARGRRDHDGRRQRPLPRTSENALKVLELAGRPDIPVHAGCPGPMVKKLMTAECVHGETGLDVADLPRPSSPSMP